MKLNGGLDPATLAVTLVDLLRNPELHARQQESDIVLYEQRGTFAWDGGILIVAALASGYLSDRLQRRKIFVVSAGLVVAVSMLMLAFAHSWGLVIGVAVLFGLGYGVYLGVDFALVADVLPSPETRGVVVAGRTIEEAVIKAISLEMACQVQLLAASANPSFQGATVEEAQAKNASYPQNSFSQMWNYFCRQVGPV
jgi:Major Facilitator Superfamily